jgi:hypothetical protein
MAEQRGDRTVLIILALGALAVYAAGTTSKVVFDGLALADAMSSAEPFAAVAGWLIVSPVILVLSRRRRSG